MITRWLVNAEETLAIALIPKAGSTTIRKVMEDRGCTEMGHTSVMRVPHRIAFVREPLDRLISCYSYFHAHNGKERTFFPIEATETWEAFIDYILEHKDKHWAQQTELVGGFATSWYRLEHIGNILGGDVPRLRQSIHEPVNNYRYHEITAYYYRDFLAYWNCGA